MNRRALLELAPRLAAAWVAFTAIAIFYGTDVVWWCRSLVEEAVEVFVPGFAAIMLAPHGNLGEVGMAFRALGPVPIAGQYVIGGDARLEESIPAGQDLLPAVLLLSLLAAWPHRSWIRGILGAGLGVLAGAALFIWTNAMHFAAQFEVLLQGYAANIHQERPVPAFMSHYIFIILGGEWFFSILIALAIAAYVNRGKHTTTDPRTAVTR